MNELEPELERHYKHVIKMKNIHIECLEEVNDKICRTNKILFWLVMINTGLALAISLFRLFYT